MEEEPEGEKTATAVGPPRLPSNGGGDPRRLPVGVFDSGLGGLTVVRRLVEHLPGESFHYFGDTARVPYGTKSPEAIRRFSLEAAHFLLERGVKMIVVACNTATAHALETLRAEADVPVVGVIEAGARTAHHSTETGRIGVIGTPGTIGSGAYDRAVRRLRPAVEVYAQSCPMFVPLVEEGLADHQAARLIAREYLEPLAEMDIDTLVLGCTHYPVLRPLISEIMGPSVRLIDSAQETALEVGRVLEREGLLHPGDAEPTLKFAVSDLPLRFRTVGRHLVGDLIGVVERVEVEGRLETPPAEP